MKNNPAPGKRIAVSVTNDLLADNRVHKVCLTLTGMGFDVLLTGRRYRNSPDLISRSYAMHRMHLLFRKGPLFYAEYNLRLLFRLLLRRCDLLLANDTDTLPANVLAGIIKKVPVVFDSHELFTAVPELVSRPRVQKIWQRIEKFCIPRVDAAFTVCDSIAGIYTAKYGIPFRVVRNLPLPLSPDEPEAGGNIREPGTRPVIIYQGALNLARGLDKAILAMQFLPEATLLLAGTGDKDQELRDLARKVAPRNVTFAGRLPLEQLMPLTRRAALGISVEEDVGLSYRYTLPNKLFDYIQARIPVVVSNLPEMRNVVEYYNIGLVAHSHEPEKLAEVFRKALFTEELRTIWQVGLARASRELTWDREKEKIEEIFYPYSRFE